jgi:hypothetical protein
VLPHTLNDGHHLRRARFLRGTSLDRARSSQRGGEKFDRFLKTFATKGAEKRRQHGSKGSTVFRDPNENDRVWVLFDWDASG